MFILTLQAVALMPGFRLARLRVFSNLGFILRSIFFLALRVPVALPLHLRVPLRAGCSVPARRVLCPSSRVQAFPRCLSAASRATLAAIFLRPAFRSALTSLPLWREPRCTLATGCHARARGVRPESSGPTIVLSPRSPTLRLARRAVGTRVRRLLVLP